jgi:hypothetical protein
MGLLWGCAAVFTRRAHPIVVLSLMRFFFFLSSTPAAITTLRLMIYLFGFYYDDYYSFFFLRILYARVASNKHERNLGKRSAEEINRVTHLRATSLLLLQS